MVEQPSPTWSEITGQTTEDMIGRGWLDLVHPDHRNRIGQAWDTAVANHTVFEEEYLLRRRKTALIAGSPTNSCRSSAMTVSSRNRPRSAARIFAYTSRRKG